nr:MAG TPA: hypothetical protein [Caudoviricetes sp.]
MSKKLSDTMTTIYGVVVKLTPLYLVVYNQIKSHF